VQINRVNKYSYTPECAEMHILVEMIARGRDYFTAKTYAESELIMHIPLPLQALLVQVLGVFGVKTYNNWPNTATYILGMRCVPAYENRIIITHPQHAIFENEPLVIIELEVINGINHPTYCQSNEPATRTIETTQRRKLRRMSDFKKTRTIRKIG
jgi:hypothetical protein